MLTISVEKSFITDPLTTNNAIYCDSLTLKKERKKIKGQMLYVYLRNLPVPPQSAISH